MAIGTDETTPVTADIQRWLSERGHDVLVVGEMLDAFLAAEPEPDERAHRTSGDP